MDRMRYTIGAALICAALAQAQAPMTVTQTVTLIPRVDVFRVQQQKFTLAGLPAANTAVMVFVNGSLMLQGEDYALLGNGLTFTAQQIGETPIIQVMYWVNASALPAVWGGGQLPNQDQAADRIKAAQEREAHERAVRARIEYQASLQPKPTAVATSEVDRQWLIEQIDRFLREQPSRVPILWQPPAR